MERALELVKNWQSAARDMKQAADLRHDLNFEKAFDRGQLCFESIKLMIQNGCRNELLKFSEEVDAALELWRDALVELEIWLSEVGEELKFVRQRLAKGGKLAGAYAFMKHSGHYLKVEAQ